MKLRLSITVPPAGESKNVELNTSYIVVGRKNANLIIDDNRCSQQHLLLYQSPDGNLWLRDLESTNGTYVNEERVNEFQLSAGDEIRVGKSILRVEAFEAAGENAGSTDEEDVTASGVHVEQTHANTAPGFDLKKKKGIGKDPGLVNTWPQNWSAAPKELQDKFIDYVDEKGTRTKVKLKHLLKTGS